VVVRLFNLESRAADGVISFSVPVQEAYELSLLDERIERCHLFQETSLRLSFLPKQIRTIEVVLGSALRRD
jgi:alpha-mannosidase